MMYNYNSYGSTYNNSMSDAGIWLIISLVIAIIGGICLYFTVFSDRNKDKYTGFMAKLYEFIKFKKLYITEILKITYLMLAIYITLGSFSLIGTSFFAFLLMLVFGNLIIRMIYEFTLVLLSIHENVSEINKKMKK